MTTVHVDLRELSGLPTDAYVPEATLRIAPAQRVHVEGGSDYVLVENYLLVRIVDGVAEFDVPATDIGQALVINEDGFRGARPRYVAIPDQLDVNYGDLIELDPDTLDLAAEPEAAWWAALDTMVVDGSVVGDDLILERQNGGTINAGDVRGPQGLPGEGLPIGGTVGQVPVKQSGTDFDVAWADATGGEADLAGLQIASCEDNQATNYTIPVYPGFYQPVPNMVMAVPPTDQPVRLEFGGHFLCTTGGTGTFYLGIADVTTPTPLEQCCNFRSGSFVNTGFAAVVGSLNGGHIIQPSASWRLYALTCVLFQDSPATLAGVLTSSSAGGVGTTVLAHSRPAFMRAVLA